MLGCRPGPKPSSSDGRHKHVWLYSLAPCTPLGTIGRVKVQAPGDALPDESGEVNHETLLSQAALFVREAERRGRDAERGPCRRRESGEMRASALLQ